MRINSDGCGGCAGCGCRGLATHPEAAGAIAVTPGPPPTHPLLDRLFLHPRWGFAGSLAVFALVLFIVFEVSSAIDAATTARLAEAASRWRPGSTIEVLAKAIVDGLVGLAGIVLPYMIPLMILLVALEQTGLMPRIAIVVDRAFHRIGLHGNVAIAFLTGLGCNVPAISAAARSTAPGRERLAASVLVTLVPCSARSAIILAVAGKTLGAPGVLAIFSVVIVVVALVGRLLGRPSREPAFDALRRHAIPPYALPRWRPIVAETWARSRDVVTVVLPLLVAGSVVLALLAHWGMDRAIDAVLTPVTRGWLGLPVALGVPLLFGVLRKELSLLMIGQALGTYDVGTALDATQVVALLLFLTFYLPCVSTFAVMGRTLGWRGAAQAAGISVAIALGLSGIARVSMATAAGLAG